MSQRYPRSGYYKFGGFRLDARHNVLYRGAEFVRCEPKTRELLRVFVNNPGKILSIDFLIQQVWNGSLDTENRTLSYHMSRLRDTLGDDAKHPSFIATVPKLGFRFICPVIPPVPSSAAASSYQWGRFLYHKSTPRDLLQAIEQFEHVIELSEDYVADAYAGIAEAFVLLGTFGHQIMSPVESSTRARDAARSALAIDAGVAEAHAALAAVAALHDWDWPVAEQHFREALRLPANELDRPLVRSWYSLCLAGRGEREAARAQIDQARREYPTSVVLVALSGRVAYLARDYSAALAELDRGLILDDGFFLNHVFRGHALRGAGKFEEAKQAFELAAALTRYSPVCLMEVGHIAAMLGRKDEALKIIERLEATSASAYVSPYLLAHVYLGVGDVESALKYLDAAVAERSAFLIFLSVDPIYDSLRGEKRFERLVDCVGFHAPTSRIA